MLQGLLSVKCAAALLCFAHLVIELKPGLIVVFIYQRSVYFFPVLTGSAKVGRGDLKELGTPEDGVVHDPLSKLAHD